MSIDFSTLQGLTIPEGVVTQITDAAGNVLWSAVKNAKVTFFDCYSCTYYIDYSTPDGDSGSIASAGTYELPIGTTLTFSVTSSGSTDPAIYLNNASVGEVQKGEAKYTYTISTDIAFATTYANYNYALDIVEITDGYVAFALDHKYGYGSVYLAEKGATWAEWSDSDFFSSITASYYMSFGDTVTFMGSTIYYNGTAVLPTDVIVSGAVYTD